MANTTPKPNPARSAAVYRLYSSISEAALQPDGQGDWQKIAEAVSNLLEMGEDETSVMRLSAIIQSEFQAN
jgi:hypothetical protein